MSLHLALFCFGSANNFTDMGIGYHPIENIKNKNITLKKKTQITGVRVWVTLCSFTLKSNLKKVLWRTRSGLMINLSLVFLDIAVNFKRIEIN